MPFKPDTRQYRSFAASNFKPVEREKEFDEEGNEIEQDETSYKVRGYASTFNEEYELWPRTGGLPAEYEQVDTHAFDSCDMSDVIFQFDHAGMVLARNRNNSMTVGTDDHGLWVEANLGGCQQGRDLFEAIQNGLIDEMSFGFMIADDDDGYGVVSERDEQRDWHSRIVRVSKLFDVSAVSRPANPGTDISEMRKRSYLAATIEADRKAEAEEKRKAEEAEKAAAEQKRKADARRRRARAMQLSTI